MQYCSPVFQRLRKSKLGSKSQNPKNLKKKETSKETQITFSSFPTQSSRGITNTFFPEIHLNCLVGDNNKTGDIFFRRKIYDKQGSNLTDKSFDSITL